MLVSQAIKKNIGFIVFFVTVVFLITVYKIFDPIANDFFPKCPLFSWTGLLCPGCGSQRAAHSLLNFDFIGAMGHNPLFVISIPYIVLGFGINLIDNPSKRVLRFRKLLFGQKAIYVLLVIIVSYFIYRNV